MGFAFGRRAATIAAALALSAVALITVAGSASANDIVPHGGPGCGLCWAGGDSIGTSGVYVFAG